MGSKSKSKDDGLLMRRIAVYLAGFLGGLLVYTVLKVRGADAAVDAPKQRPHR